MVYETPIHIVAARRSPIGRFDGGLKKFTAPELASHTAEASVPAALRPHIGQVILGPPKALEKRLGYPRRGF